MRKPEGKQVEIEELQREQPEELTPEAAEEAQGGLGIARLLQPNPPPIEPSVTPIMTPQPPPI